MLSNIFKSGIPGVRTVSQEPFVIDANSRVIEPPKARVIRPKNDVPEGSAEAGDTFEAGITEMAATINLEEHKELLDDAMEKAKLLQDDARERAQKILEDAKADAEAIRKAAQEEGFAKGLEDGNMEAMRRADEYLEKISRERDQALAQAREEMMENITDTEEQIVDVACKLIQKLTGILVDDYKPVMIYMINQVLNEDEDSRKFVIRVSEENYTYIADNADRLSGAANPGITIEIFSDTKLQKGQCQIESDTGIVDLSMDVQVRNLITAIKLLSTQ